jgi:hypothetical protein
MEEDEDAAEAGLCIERSDLVCRLTHLCELDHMLQSTPQPQHVDELMRLSREEPTRGRSSNDSALCVSIEKFYENYIEKSLRMPGMRAVLKRLDKYTGPMLAKARQALEQPIPIIDEDHAADVAGGKAVHVRKYLVGAYVF